MPAFPEALADIKLTTSFLSLEAHIKRDISDVNRFPEVANVAEVRRGNDLCPQERAFVAARKARVAANFAKYIGVDPAEVNPEDVPTVAFGGSGGGYRAMIATMGYCEEFRRAGLWDLLTYVSGVSGSCWSLAAYYTFGQASFGNVIAHAKKRLSPHHPLSAEAIRTTLSVPGGANVTLGPLVQKSHSGLHTVAMDLYSVFTTGYLFLQDDPSKDPQANTKKELAGHHREWFRWSSAITYLEHGQEPLPILTAIRHERPWKDWVDKEHPFVETKNGKDEEQQDDAEAWYVQHCMSLEISQALKVAVD